MVVNDYTNLYECDYYKDQSSIYNFNGNNAELHNFENEFVIANAVFLESKKCYVINDNEIIVYDNTLIKRLLSEHPLVFDILKKAYEVEKERYKSDFISSLELCVMVCEKNLKELNDGIGLRLVN